MFTKSGAMFTREHEQRILSEKKAFFCAASSPCLIAPENIFTQAPFQYP